MTRVRLAVCIAVVLFGGIVAPVNTIADEAQRLPPIEWRCVQEHDEYYHIFCAPRATDGSGRFSGIRGDLRDDPYFEDILGDTRPTSREVRPARMNMDLRPVAHRGRGEVFASGGWRVPLFSLPHDVAEVNRLLVSVLCGGVANCSVTYRAEASMAAARHGARQ